MDAILLTCNQTPDNTIQRYLGPYKIAHKLRLNNFSCCVLDFIHNDVVSDNFSWSKEDFYKKLTTLITKHTLLIGFSLTFWKNLSSFFEIKNFIKNNYPNIKIIVGGSFNVRDSATFQHVDAWIRGYGEDILLSLISYYKYNTTEPSHIRSLEYKVKEYGNVTFQSEFENCVFDWEPIDKIQVGESLPIELSRGCIFKCKFCNFPNIGKRKKDYIKNSDIVKNEIRNAFANYKTSFFQIVDDTFNESSDKVETFMKDIRDLNIPINFGTFSRCDLLQRFPETIDYFERSQIASVAFGIETLNANASKIIGKGWNGTKECTEFLKKLSKRWNNKINIHCTMIVGLPGESEKDIWENRQRLIDTGVSSFNYYPLTMQHNRTATMLSFFEKNYKDYGFEFKGELDWINNTTGWTFQRAFQLSKELMAVDNPYSWMKTENWRVHRYITTKTATIEDILTKPNSYIDKNLYKKNATEWLKNYYNSWN